MSAATDSLTTNDHVAIGVLTSGGDAQGMNAAVRAVVRSAIHWGAQPYAIREGWQGAVDGGDGIAPLSWDEVGNILHRGGTSIGTARCDEFRTREGMRTAAFHLVSKGIDRIVVIGGDGSLRGAEEFMRFWPELLAELVELGQLDQAVADRHAKFHIVGLVGTIDNDLVGTDTTIGSDSALTRVGEALDAIRSTAASHQRSFVVEVMGRKCGYLPLMAAIAGGCDAVFVPENPPAPGWGERLAQKLRAGRENDRRESIVLVAEGAVDRDGVPVTAQLVADQMQEHLGEKPRITILGHVQRGGNPSAYDRWMGTALGVAASGELLFNLPDEAIVLGTRHNRIVQLPLMEAVANTSAVAKALKERDFEAAMQGRGASFRAGWSMLQVLSRPTAPGELDRSRGRIAVLHASALSPGMNTAVWAAVRFGRQLGYDMLGVHDSFGGLAQGNVRSLGWADVEGWFAEGGAELGTSRSTPTGQEMERIAEVIEQQGITGLLLVGGLRGYYGLSALRAMGDELPGLNIPMMALPASIDNNLPGTLLSVGSDTALNNIATSVDAIKQSASAHQRCFLVETMGRHCGYLAAMTALATGAERVYLPEEGVSLADLHRDVDRMREAFEAGRRLFLAVQGEYVNQNYPRDVMARIFEEEGGDLFDVRHLALGHIQQGGKPSPFDRTLATQLAWFAVNSLHDQVSSGGTEVEYCGVSPDGVTSYPIAQMADQMDVQKNRPSDQWWLSMREVIKVLATSAPMPSREWE